MTKRFDLRISCAESLETALIGELVFLGLQGEKIAAGRVAVNADLAGLYRICLYSRVASRVLLPLGEYCFKPQDDCQSQDDFKLQNGFKSQDDKNAGDVANIMYEFASTIDWTTVFGVNNSFVVKTSVDKRVAVNQQFATLRIKDAIADRFYQRFNARPNVDSRSPDFVINAHIGLDKASLALDLSGTSLHRRGYRVANTDAPLKENLAAALLYVSGWHRFCDLNFNDQLNNNTLNNNTLNNNTLNDNNNNLNNDDLNNNPPNHQTKPAGQIVLCDPMCGSGTFIIEALLMYFNYPVGIDKNRQAFGFMHWQYHDENLWQQLCQQALANFHHQLYHKPMLKVFAYDSQLSAIAALYKNIQASALAPMIKYIQFAQQPLSQLSDTLHSLNKDDKLFLITNPPYGERLGYDNLLKPLYQNIAMNLIDHAPYNTKLAILAGKAEELDLLPIDNNQTLKCHNGALSVYFRYGQIKKSPSNELIKNVQKQPISIDNDDNLDEFINRIYKNLNHLKKHAKKERVSNLRIYDADLPNFNAAIDIYGDKIHIQEYAPPKHIDEYIAKRRFNLVLLAIRQIFNLDKQDVFIKTRSRQLGNEQYSKSLTKGQHKRYIVREHQAYFYVNLSEYLDTGLFIDHRIMRQLIHHAAYQKNVLNLYAYTCTASVQAALGGATSVSSVDLSENYLQWGQENFALNGLDIDSTDKQGNKRFCFIASDVFEWLKNHSKQYDVIFIDPPTFSNSKKFYGTFDVQRDHVSLINRAMNRLTKTGVLFFSNNYSRFILDKSLYERYDIDNITHQTISFDFDKQKPIHQSFKICHKQNSHLNNGDLNNANLDNHDLNNADLANAHLNNANLNEYCKNNSPKNDSLSAKKSKKPSHHDKQSHHKHTHNKTIGNKAIKHKTIDKQIKPKQKNNQQSQRLDEMPNKKSINANGQSTKAQGTKRVYVNPKLANGADIAHRLQMALLQKQTQEKTQAQERTLQSRNNPNRPSRYKPLDKTNLDKANKEQTNKEQTNVKLKNKPTK